MAAYSPDSRPGFAPDTHTGADGRGIEISRMDNAGILIATPLPAIQENSHINSKVLACQIVVIEFQRK